MKVFGRLILALALLSAVLFSVCFVGASAGGGRGPDPGASGQGAAGQGGPAGQGAAAAGQPGPADPNSAAPGRRPLLGTGGKLAIAGLLAAAAAGYLAYKLGQKPAPPQAPKAEVQELPEEEDFEE